MNTFSTELMTEPMALGDLPHEEVRAHLHRMADWVADYREGIGVRSIQPQVNPGDIATAAGALGEAGEPMTRILDDLDAIVLPGVLHWGHPAFLGYFGSTSNGPALLGEIAAAALNVSAMTWKTSPAATELETVVLRWLRELIGLDDRLMGIVYDTASVATLHALAAAREGAGAAIRTRGLIGRDDLAPLRVYVSDQAHSSVDKSMVMLGLGEENVVRLPSDPAFRLDPATLRAAITADLASGRRPMAVVATVGSTSTASVDPVAAIAEICEEFGVWLHVDAAYGGAMGALPEGRAMLAGTERADSVVVNPHKWLFVPLDFSALYVRRPEALRAVFALTPEYLAGDAAAPRGATVAGAAELVNYMDYGIQLGRRFRALKAWMAFRAFGRAGIAARVREHCRLAELLAQWIGATPGFALTAPRSMGVVCFRYVPAELPRRATADARSTDATDALDALNVEIVERVNASGDAYLTHTRLRGRTCMRVGFGNVSTTEVHVAHVWERVQYEAGAAAERIRAMCG